MNQLVNKATQGDYQSIRRLVIYCSWLPSELTEPSRQLGGLSFEEGEAIRRALLGIRDEAGSVAKENPSSAEHAPIAVTPEVQPQEEEKRIRQIGRASCRERG